MDAYRIIRNELREYSQALAEKPEVTLAEAAATYARLEAEAKGQYEIMSKRAQALGLSDQWTAAERACASDTSSPTRPRHTMVLAMRGTWPLTSLPTVSMM